MLQWKYTNGNTAFQIEMMIDGHRVRETFKTRATAEDRTLKIRIMNQLKRMAADALE